MFLRTLLMGATLLVIASCTPHKAQGKDICLDKFVEKVQGVVPVKDNGIIENWICDAYRFFTGQELGMSKKDFMKSHLSLDDIAIILQNVVEKHHKDTMVSREQIIETILFKAHYDSKVDGRICIENPEVVKTNRRLKRIERMTKQRSKHYSRRDSVKDKVDDYEKWTKNE